MMEIDVVHEPPVSDSTPRVAAIIVSANSAGWLRPCLTTLYERAGDVELDVVVVAAGCTDETVSLVAEEFPAARTIECPNRGFGYANNRGLRTVRSDWVLFLNPDTEILEGTFGELVRALEARPTVGLAGVRQVTADGELFPTIRRFPSVRRSSSRPSVPSGTRCEPRGSGSESSTSPVYDREVECDWTTGSFMLARLEALQGAGSSTSASSSLRGNRSVPADQARRVGDQAPAGHDDPPSRREEPVEPAS